LAAGGARRGAESSPVHTDADADLDQSTTTPAADQGANYISMRRLSELVGATTLEGFAALGHLLAHHRPDRYAPSIYRVAE
jgi:hypothetical protein